MSKNTTRDSKRNAHIVALNIQQYISADQAVEDILKDIRRQGALSIACHPHHRTTTRLEIGTCYLWDHRKKLADLVDVWEAANRDDLFSVTSLKHYPYVANSDFHKAKHLYSWKTLRAAINDGTRSLARYAPTSTSLSCFIGTGRGRRDERDGPVTGEKWRLLGSECVPIRRSDLCSRRTPGVALLQP